jgi:hypothetical protein
MILVRAWRRQLVGGVGVALVVPTTLLASLAVLTLAGGFAGLGALGQAFSGPSLEAGGAAPPRRAISSVLPAALTSPAPPASTSSVAAGGKGRGTVRGRPRSRAAPVTRPGGGAVGPVGRQPQPGGQPATPAPTPTPRPTLTDDLVAPAASATSQLPPPVGSVTTGVLRSVGATLDQILPVPAPGPPQIP